MLIRPREIIELDRDDTSCSESRNDVSLVPVPEESSANIHSSAATSGNKREFGDSGGDASKCVFWSIVLSCSSDMSLGHRQSDSNVCFGPRRGGGERDVSATVSESCDDI